METIKIIKEPITRAELKKIAEERLGDMVKAVVDVEKEVMAVGGDMHADEEEIMLENESAQRNLWGINLYPDLVGDDFVEFDSMINLRPGQNNRSRFIEDENIRKKILEIVGKLILS